jgi:hypothetical protein
MPIQPKIVVNIRIAQVINGFTVTLSTLGQPEQQHIATSLDEGKKVVSSFIDNLSAPSNG